MSLDYLKGLENTDTILQYLQGDAPNFTGDKPYERIYRDCLVMVDNSFTVKGSNSNHIYDISQHVTSVNVNYNVDSPPGTCDITIRTPMHMVDGENHSQRVKDNTRAPQDNLLLREMSEVKVFMKNRFPYKGSGFFGKDKGKYGFSQVFWGIITRVMVTESPTENTVTLNCSDMTWWFQRMRMNIHPASTVVKRDNRENNPHIGANLFRGKNCFEIIRFMIQHFPEDLVTNVNDPVNLTRSTIDPTKASANVDVSKWIERYGVILDNVVLYWAKEGSPSSQASRGSSSGSAKNTDDTLEKKSINGLEKIGKERTRVVGTDKKVRTKEGVKPLLGTNLVLDESLLDSVIPFDYFKAEAVYESEFKNRLEVAQEVARFIGYEFFQDTNGEISFKPPLYNMYVSEHENPVYVVHRLDLISADFSSDANDVVTEIQGQGRMPKLELGDSKNNHIFGLYRDSHMLSTYGVQETSVQLHWATTPKQVFGFIIGELDRLNSRRFSSSLQITGRPELRLGRPVYLSWKDAFYYIRGLSHSYSNGSFTTTLDLDSRRGEFTDKTTGNRWENAIAEVEAEKGGESEVSEEKVDKSNTVFMGGYPTYRTGNVGHANIDVEGGKMTMQVSDEAGYELIGAFKYGRDLMLDSRGNIVKRTTSKKVEVVSSVDMAPEGIMSIEKQDGHPDVYDDEFNPAFNNFFESVYDLGAPFLTKLIQSVVGKK